MPNETGSDPGDDDETADEESIEDDLNHFIATYKSFTSTVARRDRAHEKWLTTFGDVTTTRKLSPQTTKRIKKAKKKRMMKLEWLKDQKTHRTNLKDLYISRSTTGPDPDGTSDLRIDDIYIIYNDGRMLLHHATGRDRSIDEDIVTGMFAALQEFVKDSLKDYEEQELNTLQYGDVSVFFEHGDFIFLAIVGKGADSVMLRSSLHDLLDDFEATFQEQLTDWDGGMTPYKSYIDRLKAFADRFT